MADERIDQPNQTADAPGNAGSPKEGGKPRGKRILVVDDDFEIVDSMRLALEAKGYQTLIARDGNQGLALAEREDPDLVILDMMMPKRSGFLVLEKLRRTRPRPDPGHHDNRQRGEPAQGLRRDARRRRLHPQALRHGPPARQRRAAAGVRPMWHSRPRLWRSPSCRSGTPCLTTPEQTLVRHGVPDLRPAILRNRPRLFLPESQDRGFGHP